MSEHFQLVQRKAIPWTYIVTTVAALNATTSRSSRASAKTWTLITILLLTHGSRSFFTKRLLEEKRCGPAKLENICNCTFLCLTYLIWHVLKSCLRSLHFHVIKSDLTNLHLQLPASHALITCVHRCSTSILSIIDSTTSILSISSALSWTTHPSLTA